MVDVNDYDIVTVETDQSIELAHEGDGQSSRSRDAATGGGQSSTTTAILDEFRSLNKTFSTEIKSVSERVDRLAETVYGGPPAAKRTKRAESSSSSRASGHTSRDWADRKDSGLEAPLPRFPDESCDEAADSDGESSSPSSAAKLSEDSQTLISNSFASSISNAERRKIRANYPHSGLQQTRCPKLDPIFKTVSGKAETKANGTELARLQAFVLDPVGPLLLLLNKLETEDAIEVEEAVDFIHDALRLLGNASAQFSTARRKRVLKALNPDIQDLASEKGHFKEAAPKLFGPGFEKAMKERAESIKILAKMSTGQTDNTTSNQSQQRRPRFYQKNRSNGSQQQRSGNQYYQRGGRQWQNKRPASSE